MTTEHTRYECTATGCNHFSITARGHQAHVDREHSTLNGRVPARETTQEIDA